MKILRSIFAAGALFTAGMTIASKTLPCRSDNPALWAGEVRASDPVAAKVASIDEALIVLPRFTDGGNNPTPYDTALGIQRFARARFYHGYSSYRFCENWVANLSGLVRPDLPDIISPEDILSRPYAGCSQQGIVVQELLKRRGLEYGTFGVRAPTPHFASVAKINGTWYYVDSWGPLPRGRDRLIPAADLFSGRRLAEDFPTSKGEEFVRATNGGLANIDRINEFPGPRGLLFQQIAMLLSRFAWLAVLLSWLGTEVALSRRPISKGSSADLSRGYAINLPKS